MQSTSRWRTRTSSIRFQLLVGLVALEALSLLLFGLILVWQQRSEIATRVHQRLANQVDSLSSETTEALSLNRPDGIDLAVRLMGKAPNVQSIRITSPDGKVLFWSEGAEDRRELSPVELAQVPQIKGQTTWLFRSVGNQREGVKPILYGNHIWGYVWIQSDTSWDYEQLVSMLRSTLVFGSIWICASILLGLGLSISITRQLAVLHRGTRALMQSPETAAADFPLPLVVPNEIGDLIEAFNRMVASIEEQRAGLNDTLSLLDSMLANAPIGLAFFDRSLRFVRVNRIFSEMTGAPISRHLGRTLAEVLPPEVSAQIAPTLDRVFDDNQAIRDLEITGHTPGLTRPWTWIASAYPIRTEPGQVRWAGLIVMDASDRKRSEEALRKSEKLAATGRLAASIAHEINNPLEAITNLLYLITHHTGLDPQARHYAEMAEAELRRIAEITQQTLRFYRQSTLPAKATLHDLMDSVISLHSHRMSHMGIAIERRYDPAHTLFCFAGEMRQVLANLIGNAMDAMPAGGTLHIRARRSRHWAHPGQTGLRFVIADTGTGIAPEARRHIFEAFFTTKEATGTGLGLWVSSEIVAKHHGSLRVRSRVASAAPATGTGLTGTVASGTVATGTVFVLFIPDQPTATEPAPNRASGAISTTIAV